MNQAAIHRLLAKNKLSTPAADKKNDLFELRLAANLTIIQDLFFSLYPREKHEASFQKLLTLLPQLFDKRPSELQKIDIQRQQQGNWYQSEQLTGMQLYVDNFNKDLKGLASKLSYFESLGITLLHLMPLTTRPQGANDGGYAVNSYTQIDKKYGTKADLLALTKKLRAKKMFLMLDFVVNHTSDEYPWAIKAARGEEKYQNYYYTYPTREIPNAFERNLPEIFPTTAPGNFTFNEQMQRWVMTVFNTYQWDLNYTNPDVFMDMLSNLIAKVNLGVDVVRFDALAFLWKKIGTDSQNLPEAHNLIALFRMCLQVIAPGVVLLAEAIVAPRDIIKYFGEGLKEGNECEIAYNASLMALLWNSIATKKTNLLYHSLKSVPLKPPDGTWINYIRCHDDIGLGYEDSQIYQLGWEPGNHRKFLLDYYCQRLDWSPAKGFVFMHNPKTGDGRITGSAASLLGLEKGIDDKDPQIIQQALDKIVMMHAIILSYGGIPMIYAGDELGTLNDYSYLDDPSKKNDNRWVNRPSHDWALVAALAAKSTPASQLFNTLKRLIGIRRKTVAFADQNNLIIHNAKNQHILVYERTARQNKGVLVACNFDEKNQVIEATWVENLGYAAGGVFKDLITGNTISVRSGLLQLKPYQILWLSKS